MCVGANCACGSGYTYGIGFACSTSYACGSGCARGTSYACGAGRACGGVRGAPPERMMDREGRKQMPS